MLVRSAVALLLLCILFTYSEGSERCLHDHVMKAPHIQALMEDAVEARDELRKNAALMGRADAQLRIPVVWHVLYLSESDPTFVSREAIEQEMVYLNQWYSASNRYFDLNNMFADDIARADDLKLEFVLADQDPSGNPFDGINYRINFAADSCNENNAYSTSAGGQDIWDPTQYYNIIVCNVGTQGTVGFSFLPTRTPHGQDGTVLDYTTVGSEVFGGSVSAHETGHYLGLYHPFEGSSCSTDDNLIILDDTPNTDLPLIDFVPLNAPCPDFTSDPAYARCGNIAMLGNCMDYTLEECYNYFSKGQALLMRAYMQSNQFYRSQLTSSPALPATCGTYDCSGKNCGSDGCGGFCGECSSQFECNSGVCEPLSRTNTGCNSAASLQPTTGGNSITADNTNLPTGGRSCRAGGNFILNHPLFYTFTASASGGIRADTIGSFLDTEISVYGGPCDGLSCVAYNDDADGESYSIVEFQVTAGTRYLVVVTGFAGDEGQFNLRLTDLNAPACVPNCDGRDCGDDGCSGSCGTCAADEFCNSDQQCIRPVDNNDACSDATELFGGVTRDESNLDATNDFIACDSTVSSAVWYQFSGTGSLVTVDTCDDVKHDSVLHVFRGSCSGLTCVARDDDSCPSSLGSRVTFCAQSGVNYYIAVDGFNGRQGAFDIRVTDTGSACSSKMAVHATEHDAVLSEVSWKSTSSHIAPREILAPNESCDTAVSLDSRGFPGSVVQISDSTATSTTAITSACITSTARGLWYSFTGTGNLVRIDTCTETASTSYNSVVQVISGGCGNSATCEAYARHLNSPDHCQRGVDAVIETVNGRPYYILVEGESGETGDFVLQVKDTGLSRTNPVYAPCSNAQSITAGSTTTVVLKDYPPAEVQECERIVSPDGFITLASAAYFRFTAPNSGQYVVDICSELTGTFDLQVYRGDCNNLECFGSFQTNRNACPNNNDQNSRSFCTEAGTTYTIVVYNGYGSFDLTLQSEGSCNIDCVPLCGSGSICQDDTCGGVCDLCDGTCDNGVCVPDADSPSSSSPTRTRTRTPSPSSNPPGVSSSRTPAPSASRTPAPSASRTSVPVGQSQSRTPAVSASRTRQPVEFVSSSSTPVPAASAAASSSPSSSPREDDDVNETLSIPDAESSGLVDLTTADDSSASLIGLSFCITLLLSLSLF